MTKTSTLKVPVNLLNGGIYHDTDYARGAKDRAEAAAINAQMDSELGHHRWGVTYVMESVEPFTTALKLVDIYHHKSSAYARFMTPDGRRFPMFLTDLEAILPTANMKDGWLEPDTYEVCKRGANSYGIRKVKNS